MASPVYRSPATSPPYPASASLPNPKKRPSLSVTSHGPAAKRRKPTNASQSSTPATSHPLRQTSFPPDESAIDTGERSPSVESDVTGHQSVMTSATGRKPKKRGRKRKTDEVTVVSGGRATAAADAASATGQAADEPEDDEDDADAEVMGDQEKQRREQQKQKEKADLSVLVDHFNPDQSARYETMRRVKLRKETVRRIVNQTLSQSVPPSIVTGIIGYTKVYMGLMVERARDVQEQNAAVAAYPSPPSESQSFNTAVASQSTLGKAQANALPTSSFGSMATTAFDPPFTTSPDDSRNPQTDTDGDLDRPPDIDHNDIFGTSSTPPPQSNFSLSQLSPISGLKPPPNPAQQSQDLSFDVSISSPPDISNVTTSQTQKGKSKGKIKDLGPLLPDDFREALRRIKRDGDVGEIGQSATSLMGIGLQGSFAAGRGKGRRLFR
ncbi:MAG: hypothetical protein Q9169_002132 [Polycauliona sp. 2 TL-2023]